MRKTKEVIEILQILLQDCKSQVDSLKDTENICWNCYDVGNWQCMISNLESAITTLEKIK